MDRALSDTVKRKRKRKLITRITIACLLSLVLFVSFRNALKPSIKTEEFYTEIAKKDNIRATVSASGIGVGIATKKTGQGIGLTLIREILVNHKCKFSSHSRNDGITEFKILFRKS